MKNIVFEHFAFLKIYNKLIFLLWLYLFTPSSFSQNSNKFQSFGFSYNPEKEDGLHSSDFEWWYFFGFLKVDSLSTSYDYSFITSFQRNKLGRNMFYTLVDLKTGKKYFSDIVDKSVTFYSFWLPKEHSYFKAPEQPCEPPQSPLWLCYENNKLHKFKDSTYFIFLKNKEFDLGINLIKTGFPMPVAGAGMMGYNNPEDVMYYSYPWMIASSTLNFGGKQTFLVGEGWFDHQWGKTLNKFLRWGWWGLKLENKDAINMYFLENALSGNVLQLFATISHADGKTEVIRNIKLTPRRVWVSPESGRKYPVEWDVIIPDKKMSMHISPILDDNELPALFFGTIWEGPCKAVISNGEGKILNALGFQELVGKLKNTAIEQPAK